MSALPILLGAAALFFVVSSKKSTKSDKKIEPKDTQGLEVGIKKIALPGPNLGGLKSKVCTQDQYLNSQGDCSAFWNANTEQLVIAELQKEVQKLKNQSIDAICVDQEEFGKTIPNQTPIKISKAVIYTLWPVLKNYPLPPKPSDPVWIQTIWVRVVNIYTKIICGFENKDPI